MSILKINHLNKSYGSHLVLNNINIEIQENEFCLIMGKSGCGKSTLLNIIGLLDTYDEGQVQLFNDNLPKPFSKKAEKLLKNKIGYLFQNFALIDNESVEYNLEIIMDKRKKDKQHLINEALEKVGLDKYNDKKVCECSGGEQQRVAIARLLLKPCELILADEPTGSLDSYNKKIVCDLLKKMQQEGKTIVVVTHDDYLKQYADRIINI